MKIFIHFRIRVDSFLIDFKHIYVEYGNIIKHIIRQLEAIRLSV